MRKLVENLGWLLLICVGVRIGAALVEPVLPLLVGLVVAGVLGQWLFGRGGTGGGYR